jgi:hypothetical protein
VTRTRFAILSLCAALEACGDKFTATGGTAGSAGASSAGEAGETGSAGEGNSAGAGGDAGGAGGDGGDAGGAAGASDSAGSGGLLGNAGGGTGGIGGIGGGPLDVLPRAGLLVWLSADRGIQQKDGHVQVWQDQSGNQMDATQGSVTGRPSYLSGGFNGRPTLDFDGQGQFLAFVEGFGDFSKGLTGFVVAKPTRPECGAVLELSNGSEIDDVFLGVAQGQWQYEVAMPYFKTGKVDLERFTSFAVNHRPAGSADLRVNGAALDSVQLPLPAVPESGERVNNFVGHSLYDNCDYFQGQISELILYSRTLTQAELRVIDSYLESHWALSDQGAPTP